MIGLMLGLRVLQNNKALKRAALRLRVGLRLRVFQNNKALKHCNR